MTVEATCEKINAEVKAIWSTEPDDIKRLRLGIVHAGAGSFDQYLSTMIFALTYTLAIGEHIVFDFIKAADNKKVPLDALKELTREHLTKGFDCAMFVGYVLAPRAKEFADDIRDVLDDVTSASEYKELLGAYFTYMNMLHWWLHIYFPWSLGSAFPQVDQDKVAEMQRLVATA